MLCSFSLPHNKQLLGLPAGMCIKVKVGELEQAYNPISTDETPGEVILLVKVSCSDLVRNLSQAISRPSLDMILPLDIACFWSKQCPAILQQIRVCTMCQSMS